MYLKCKKTNKTEVLSVTNCTNHTLKGNLTISTLSAYATLYYLSILYESFSTACQQPVLKETIHV